MSIFLFALRKGADKAGELVSEVLESFRKIQLLTSVWLQTTYREYADRQPASDIEDRCWVNI